MGSSSPMSSSFSQKKTPGVQYNIQLTHAADDVDLEEFKEAGGVLEEKVMKSTFWISENALFMPTDFIAALNIESSGRTF